MIKHKELSDPNSCMSRAKDDEMTFVLLARDAAAPVAIFAWINERIRLGKNKPDDEQIKEARMCANLMESQRYSNSALVQRKKAAKRIWAEDYALAPDAETLDHAFERLFSRHRGTPIASEDWGDHIIQEHAGNVFVIIAPRGTQEIYQG